MEINLDRIKSRLSGKINNDEIIKIYNVFKKINGVLKLRLGIEESIVKYFKCKLNIGICYEEIRKMVDNQIINKVKFK